MQVRSTVSIGRPPSSRPAVSSHAQRKHGRTMKRLSYFLIALVFGVIVAGASLLMVWEVPAPTTTVEKVIPNDRFAN